MLVGAALIAALLAAGWFSDLLPTQSLGTFLFPSTSCLTFEVTAEKLIPDAMRHNWRSSRLDWVQIQATNRCPEEVSFDVTFNVERAFPSGAERESVGIPCRGSPCESPRTIPVPACTLRPAESDRACASAGVVLEQLDPWLDLDLSNWNQERPLTLEFEVHAVEHGTSAGAGGLLDFLTGGSDERGDPFEVSVELRPGTTYLWEWHLDNNPRPDGDPREAALASLAVWAVAGPADRRAFAEQWPLDDSLDNWMERVYADFLSRPGFRVRTSADQLPPGDGALVIEAPETVLEEMQGSPIETALLVATLASSAISVEDRNDHVIVMMAPTDPTDQEGSQTGVFLGWVTAEEPRRLSAFAPGDAGAKEFDLATKEAADVLRGLPLEQILDEVACERDCDGVDGVYVDRDDRRVAAVNVLRAASYFGLSGGLPIR